jgi:natural product precursor
MNSQSLWLTLMSEEKTTTINKEKMKKLSLVKMEILPDELLDRSQMASVFGGTFYQCSCNGGPQFTVMTDGNPEKDAGCARDESPACIAA